VIENSPGTDDARVDELRQQLRSLGYLDAGVDRFLLAPAREQRRPVAVALGAGARVGVLAGALLGPAAAVGVGARVPGLVSGLRDAAVLALYLAVFFCAALGALASVTSLVAASIVGGAGDRFTSRARLVSSAAGWVVAVACLGYLTLWWRTANAGFGWNAPVWTTAALILAVMISLLLGHAVRVTTLAVTGAARKGGSLPPSGTRSWRPVIAGGALAFAGAAALLVVTTSADTALDPDHPALTVVSTGQRIRLIAIDGFDAGVYAQLKPSLRHLGPALGSARATLASQDTSDPARAWTTIATGVSPEHHGVHAIETRRVAGVRGVLASGGGAIARVIGDATDMVRLTRPSIASRDERQAKTMWEVAEEAGLRTAVVNWWATWPAPAAGGVVITDRAVLRLERGGPLDAEIAPATLYDPLRARWPAIRDSARAAVERAFPAHGDARAAEILRRSGELDATIVGIAQALPADSFDFVTIYLPGLDIAQNALLAPSEGGAFAPSSAAARIEALQRYYRFLDVLLASLLEAGDNTAVLLVTQPGRVQPPGEGIFAAAPGRAPGEPTSSGARTATPLDVAPTVLSALGVPLSRELGGQAVGLVRTQAPRYVPTYGRPFNTSAPRTGQPLDQEMIDRLRSLGYVK
jgi:type I phosphodiesterase/nucleotide pyrophosphatase